MKHKKFFVWWISVLLITTLVFWAGHFGIIEKIWTSDSTMITSVISFIFVCANLYIGWLSYRLGNWAFVRRHHERLRTGIQTIWFISEQLMALGMLGTVIGLIIMLSSSFIGVGQSDDAMQNLLSSMWQSMGLALYTNAVGLLCSIVLKLQIYYIGQSIDEA